MLSRSMQRALVAVAIIGGLWLSSATARADTLYFRATDDANGRTNFNWLSPNNWYTLDAMLHEQHAFTIPGAGDEAVLVTSSTLPGSALVSKVVIESGTTLTGGTLTTDFLQMIGGSAGGAALAGATVAVRAQMNVIGEASITGGTLDLLLGAFATVDLRADGSPGVLGLAGGAVFADQGSFILHDGCHVEAVVASGLSTFHIFPGADLTTAGATMITTDFSMLNIENDGHVVCNSGTLTVSGAVTLMSTPGPGVVQTTIPTATIDFTSFTLPAGSHLALKGPGTIEFGPAVNVSGLLDIGRKDPATGQVESGNLVMGSETLSGTGTLHVIASPTAASTLTMTGSVIAANQFSTFFTGTINIDPGATFFASDPLSAIAVSGTINNGGTTLFKGGDFAIWNGSTFNNLPGAVFDVQQAGTIHDAGQVGHFNNKGTFKRSGGTGEADVIIAFNNTGLIDLRAGTTKFANLVQTAGATDLNGGNLLSPSATTEILHPLDIEGGVLAGTGAINGVLQNGGTISPGPVAGPVQFGTLALSGDYTQTANGVLNVKIGGTAVGTQTDRFTMTGSATLAGTLSTPLAAGFHAQATDRFPVLTYGSETGTFGTITGPFTATYGATQMVLALNPNAPTISGFTPSGGLVGSPVSVTGTNLSGAALFFNGVRALVDPKQSSATTLMTVVPAGATTGPLKVTTAAGSSLTAAPFIVIPLIRYAISGVVTRSGKLPLANVSLLLVARANLTALAGGIAQPAVAAANPTILARTTTTASGQFSFSALPGAYFVFPVLPGVLFTPLERSVAVTTAAVPNRNFAVAATDTGIPVVTITTAAPSSVTGSATVRGISASGILTVVVTLQNSSGQFLDWTATGATPHFTATPTLGSLKTASAPGAVAPLLNLNLVLTQPWTVVPPANLAPGTYTVTARAVSRAMRVSAPVSRTFTKLAPVPDLGLANSPVALSSVAASSDNVRLRFTGALDADAATDTTRYEVEVNGYSTQVEAVSFDASRGTVTLLLATGSLRSGDRVTVAWSDLRDGQGRTLTGEARPLTVSAG